MGHSTYLLINLASVFVPFLASFHPRLQFVRRWFAFWPACAISAALFVLWDMLYTHWAIWGFNERYLLGVSLGNLPLEEVLFFVCIPYASLFTYHCLNELGAPAPSARTTQVISWALVVLLFVLGMLYSTRLYTSVTFILCGGFLFMLARSKAAWLGAFLRSYAVILIPFFVVNGILTGTLLDEPVVWYDNSHNLGIRLGTIPVEDVFYGMLMLLLNTSLYEFFLRRGLHKQSIAR